MRTQRQQKCLAGKAALRTRPVPRAAVLEGLALWLSDQAGRESARYTAGRLRQSEEHQMKLYERLTGGKA